MELAKNLKIESVARLDLSQPEVMRPTDTVADAVKRMQDQSIGCVLICAERPLLGIFTERDLLNKLTGTNASSPGAAVKDLMSADPEILDETDSVATALNKMSMGRYRHIPVRKADGSFSVTSIKHVIKYIAKAEW